MSKKALSRLIRILTGFYADSSEEPLLEAGVTKLEKFAHFWVLVWRSFVRNRCPVRASDLSYTTLLALIPMLAVAMSVTSMFLKSEDEKKIESFIQQIVDHLVPYVLTETNATEAAIPSSSQDLPPDDSSTNKFVSAPEATTHRLSTATQTNAPTPIQEVRVAAQKKAAGYIHKFIQNTYSGALGLTGVVFLLATSILMMARVEETFNDIWGVTRGRNWPARVVIYWATITLGPLLLVGALGLGSGPHLQKTRSVIEAVPLLEPIISQLLPVVLICVTFALFYKLVPNTKVHFRAALVGGTLAGVSWHIIRLLSVRLASSAVNASKIYGSLALIPLFMAGLYLIWLTVLFGAQVAYAFQNRESYLQEKLAENVNQRGREFVALRLMTCISQRFQRGLPPATVAEMSHELGIPSKLIQQVLQTMLAARLVVEVSGVETGYTPARPIETINCHHILLAMRAAQGQELVTRDEPVREEVYGEFARIQAAEKQAASTVTMLDLVNRAQARLELAPLVPERVLNPLPVSEARTELPNEPVRITDVPPATVAETTKTEPLEASAMPESRPDKKTKPTQPTTEPSTDEDRDFPL